MSNHLKAGFYKSVLLSMIFSLLGVTIALAASGDLDPTFDGDGLVTTDLSGGRADGLLAIAIQPDGKIVAAGFSNVTSNINSDFALTRYNTDGSLDISFGKRFTDFGIGDAANDVALQSDGKIVVSGRTCDNLGNCDLALARYNSDGTLDTTFSGDGKLIEVVGGISDGAFGDLAIQSNGKIVVAGYIDNGTDFDFAVFRYLSNGSLDNTFNGDGRVRVGFGAGQRDRAVDLVIQSDRKIVVAGNTSKSDGNFALIRLNPNGTLDRTFSGDGKQITNFGGFSDARGVALQPDGKIVLVGAAASNGLDTFAIARYNTNGNLDTTFGKLLPTGKHSGKRVFSIVAGVDSIAYDVIVQPDGKIVVAGTTGDGLNLSHHDFALVRLKPNGSFDPTFGQGGKVIVDFGDDDLGLVLARQPSDGKYVFGGWAITSTHFDFALARVLK
jgi:uncharacterized delta-60 repeat protein